MQIQVSSRPSYGMATVTLDAGESFEAESGAMVGMSTAMSVDTTFNGTGSGPLGWLKAAFIGLVRKFLAGETMFLNRFTASSGGQKVFLAPAMVGDVIHLTLDGTRPITVQASSYLGSTGGVTKEVVWGGLSMLFSGEGAFFLKCSGTGELLLNSYGAIEQIDLEEAYQVDTGHVVAFESHLDYTLHKASSGIASSFLSGEGLVQTFEGTGRLWLQTRSTSSLIGWLVKML